MNLKNQIAVVTGGSRGLGLGLVEALVEHGAQVTVVARNAADLDKAAKRLGVATIAADVTDREAATRIVSSIKPTILALNAGAAPSMAALVDHSWESFSNTWETDVKSGLYWIQAALTTPLSPGSRVLVGSSGAAVAGSPLSGGYGGAKRMLWLMANYANAAAEEKHLDIRFQTIVPRQMVADTGVGEAGASAYATKMGISIDAFLARFGAPLSPRQFGEYVVTVLTDPQYETDRAFGLKADTGISVLEGAVA